MTTASAGVDRKRRARPTGREAVVEAVLAAATDLFAERGPAATSIRDIAARSGVNHGLVYRHFGTKDDLVAAVLDHLSTEMIETVAAGPTAMSGTTSGSSAVEQHWRVVARAILDGYPVGQLQHRFPYVNSLVERARPHHPDELDAQIAAANAIALQLGWRLFEPFVRAAADLDSLPADRLRDAVNETTTSILGG
jgi:AcrR family transcriptional regulator